MRICHCLVFDDFVKHDPNIFYARYNPYNNPYDILFNDSYNFYLNDLNDHALRRLWVHQTHNFYLDFNDLNDHAMRRLRVHQTHNFHDLKELNDHALCRLWVHQTYNFYLDLKDLNNHAMRRLWVHQTNNIAHSYYQQVGITVHVDCRIYSNSNL